MKNVGQVIVRVLVIALMSVAVLFEMAGLSDPVRCHFTNDLKMPLGLLLVLLGFIARRLRLRVTAILSFLGGILLLAMGSSTGH